MRNICLVGAAFLVLCPIAVKGQGTEIGFVENFSLATDRSAVLSQLIPGTEEFYYYHSLHLLNTEQFDKTETLLKTWSKRRGATALYWQIRTRLSFLTYNKNPKKSLDYLQKRFKIQYPYKKEQLNTEPNVPTTLDPKLISREQFAKRALSNDSNQLKGFNESAFDWFIQSRQLTNSQRRQLLSRLTRPDFKNLSLLVANDLKARYSSGFGSLGIHRLLLLSQLEELLVLKPDLLNQQNFVQAYLKKLQPNPDEQWQHNRKQLAAYLARLQKFATRLAPVHNSLKAHVLYHQLLLDQLQGKQNKERFFSYIKLPRRTNYISITMQRSKSLQRYACNLNSNYNGSTLLKPIGNDESLVRSYLAHFFLKADNTKEFEPYINDVYLKHLFAETKIVNGLGDQERWASLLPPEKFRKLKERIDLDFDSQNKTDFDPNAPVGLDLHIKNVSTLIVKVFEINTQSHYRITGKEINTNIELDGLVANEEMTFHYKDSPLRRVKRHFNFPQLNSAGVYVIDFIGNGQSSRALIRKGRLRHLVRTSSAGQSFMILDDNNQQVKNAVIWLAGHEYKAEKNGIITVPFSTTPGRQPIVITAPTSQQKKGETEATYSSLDYFTHVAERYAMKVDFHIDRESLLARKKASLIIRPLLSVNGIPLPTKLLEDVKLTMNSINIDGTHSSQEIPNVHLFEDRESIHEFQVPNHLASLTVSLTAKVKQMTTGGTKVTLNSSKTFALNGISKTAAVEDLHLLRADNGYILELRGRTGEPKSSRPVVFSLAHRDFNIPIQIILKTDPAGRIQLHSLAGILSFSARGPRGTPHTWNLKNDRHTFSNTMHGMAAKPLTLPYMGTAKKPLRSELSLLELRSNTFVADRFENISIRDGLIVIDKLPAGDYDLFLKETKTHIKLRLAEGKKIGSFIIGDKRQLELQGLAPLQIQTISTVVLPKKVSKKKKGKKEKGEAKKKTDQNKKEKYVRIQMKNVSKFTRLHIFATRYVPQYDAFANLSQTGGAEPYLFQQTPASSVYLTGRNIGEEYRYIIERKYAPKYPGNMLARPSLLLNPWAVRPTATSSQVATDGEMFAPKSESPESNSKRSPKRQRPSTNNGNSLADLNFLAHASTVLHNLVPDENGLVEIPLALLGSHQHIHIVAIDPLNVTCRSIALKEIKPLFRDLRLLTNLQPKSHHTRQNKISIAPAGKKFILHDVTTSKFEAYDKLGKVYGLYITLGNDTLKLMEFSFILDWTTYKQKKKRELYSQYACHELNFFLFKKDPQFFKKVVQPYLQNKKDKTFLDHFLLNHNLSTYLTPWKFSQLNVVERILLAQRIEGEQARTERHLADRYALLPPDIDGFIARFNTAIQQSALNHSSSSKGYHYTQLMKMIRANNSVLWSSKDMVGGYTTERSKSRRSTELQAREESAIPFKKRKAIISALQEATEFDESMDKSFRQNSFWFGRKSEGRGGFGGGGGRRRRQLYRQLDQTFEWAENNYYHLTINKQNANLIAVNAFWKEYAAHQAKTPFLSTHLADASRNFSEMMFALSLLDLPFNAPKHKTTFDGKQMTLIPGGALVVFHEEIRPANKPDGATKVLVSQNFFKQGDRQRIVNGEKMDKFVTGEFIIHTVYGCQVVITNPTSTRQKLNVLVQIPKFGISVSGGEATKTHHIDLQPYSTKKIEYYFYFPVAGDAPQFPVHVANNEKLIASATPVTLHVVKKPSQIDTGSWDYISQQGSLNDVLTYIDQHNIENINLARIAWRMQDKATYNTIVNRLAPRHVYNQTLWSFSLKHNDVKSAREFLQHSNQIVNECGGWLNSPLLTIDLVERRTLEHFEYKPLVNARAHTLGARRKIVNDRFTLQYHRVLNDLAYRRTLSSENLLVVTYYLLLQDRVDEAIKTFKRVNRHQIATKIQYDYCAAYVDFFSDKPQKARQIAEKYADRPVDRWQKTFATIIAQLDEVEGKNVKVIDPKNRNQQQGQLAATEPSFHLAIEGEKITLNYTNLKMVRVNFYETDVELLFSRNPFVRQSNRQFVSIRPNHSINVQLPKGKLIHSIKIPAELRNKNVLIEVAAAGQTRTQPYFSNSLNVSLIENYGQVKVLDRKTGKPIKKAYVKVYARHTNGRVKFYKDGYTDLRGRFDYASLSTNALTTAKRFSVLVLTEKQGAIVREANPPKQ